MQLGWIDFSKTERNKILSVLDLLSESGTLDELGIAPVRDGFSNLFFPGTSTIQTRAKYFFVVAYALKQLEKSSETNPNKVLKALNDIERACGEQFFYDNPKDDGIIGKRSLQAGRWVKRNPSSIYWAGLRKYGMFTGGNLSLSEYVRVVCAMKTQKSTLNKLGNRNDSADENECDDKNAGELFKIQFWKIPRYDENWLENIHMQLTVEEALFLKEQIISSTKGSMIAYILENNITEFLDCEYFEDLADIIDVFPEDIREKYYLALSFSKYMYVLRTVYNVIISDEKNEEANILLEDFTPNLKDIADIDIDYILRSLSVFDNPLLRKFLKQTQEYMRSADIEQLKKCIYSREVQLKTISRAKTVHPGEFDPALWFGGRSLDYRFGNAKMIIKDIMESEGVIDVKSK